MNIKELSLCLCKAYTIVVSHLHESIEDFTFKNDDELWSKCMKDEQFAALEVLCISLSHCTLNIVVKG